MESIFIAALRQHMTQKSTGLLRVKTQHEALVYLSLGHPVHAVYQGRKGVEVLREIVSWNDAKIAFEAFHFAQERTISDDPLELIAALEGVARQRREIGIQSSSEIYYYSLSVPYDENREALEQNLIARAEGLTLEQLVTITGGDSSTVMRILQRLVAEGAIHSESSPATPERLRGITPRYAPPPKTGLFNRPKAITLDEHHHTFYEAIDGRRTLWEIRINLAWTRQAVWDAYQYMHGLKVVINAV